MTTYRMRAHEVSITQIVGIAPMMGRNSTLVSPDSGLVLVLDDNTRHRWLSEEGSVPSVGDYLVRDAHLHHDFIVAAAKFGDLFEAVSEQR